MQIEADQFMPLISVVINCYNGEEYLTQAVRSVIDQTYKNWELIFWDNQSSDRSSEIIKSFSDSRIKYFLASVHTNLGEARKMAVEKSSGEWIGFVDVDDVWLPTKLAKQVEIANRDRHSRPALIYGRALAFGENMRERELSYKFYKKPLPQGNIFKKLLASNFIACPTVLVLKEAYFEVGGFSSGYNYAPDYHLFLAIAKDYQVGVVQEYVAKYRIHEANLTTRMKESDIARECIQILSNYVEDYVGAQKRINSYGRIYSLKKYVKRKFPTAHKVLSQVERQFYMLRGRLSK